MFSVKPRALRGLAALLLTAAVSPAATLTLDAIDSGAYRANGMHNPSIESYFTGYFTTEQRSFVVFDLSAVSGAINSATLRLFNPQVPLPAGGFLNGYVSPNATETLNLWDVSTPVGSITGNTAGVAGFDDLGSGTLYGTRIVSGADNGTVIEIALNPAGVAGLNASAGLWAIGGALSTIIGTTDQYVFGFSMADFVEDHTRQLVLDVTPAAVPEPASIALCALGLGSLLWLRRTR